MPSQKNYRLLHGGLSILVVLFFFWHATAIVIYALPSMAQDPLSVFLRVYASPLIRPYILLTSQWQQWNLFAPDPLRRVTNYHLQHLDPISNVWIDAMVFRPGSFFWWQHATRFKILDRIFDPEERDRKFPLQIHFLQTMCREFSFPPETKVRILLRYYVIPNTPELTSFAWWRAWQPAWMTIDGSITPCL